MADGIRRTQTCLDDPESSTLAQEIDRLRRENEQLRQQARDVAAANAQVQESLSRLEATLEATADGIVVMDLSGDIKAFNHQFQRLWDIPEAILQTRSREEMSAYALQCVKDPVALTARLREFRQKPEASFEVVLELRNGTILECHSKPQVLGGRVVGRVWSFRDVTERRGAEQALRASEERLRRTLEAAQTVAWEADLRTGTLIETGPVATLFGRPAGATAPDLAAFLDRVHPDDRAQLLAAVRSGTGTDLYTTEYRVLLPDGSIRWILSTGRFDCDAEAQPLRLRGVARDITARKRAEDQTKESLSLLEATLNATADGILVLDRGGRIKGANRQFQHIWGIPDAAVRTGDNEKTVVYALELVKDRETFDALRKKSFAHPEEESFHVVELRDGRIIERYSRPQILGECVVGQVLSFRDVTQRHQAQEKQAALLRKVAEINEELSHFAYVVSHDLKAPLRGIKVVAEWLCEDYADKLGAEAKEQMALLQSRVDRMHNLIDGVLQYSRVGRIKEDMVDVDLNALLPVIVDTIAPPAHIRIALAPGLPTLTGEKTRLIQVFQNLLTNAVKFMDKPQGQIQVGCTDEGDFWRFQVTDNGPGIEEKHFERIFRIFQTLAPKDERESTGIGLTLVKKIVELYGGRVWLESQVGQGSTFFFTFPKHPTVELSSGPKPPPAEEEG